MIWLLLLSAIANAEDSPVPPEAPLPPEAPPPSSSAIDEGALFGGSPDTDPAASLIGGPFTSDSTILSRLGATTDRFAIGGKLYMRLDATQDTDWHLPSTTLASPDAVYLYVDGRPNDRLRAFVQGKLTHDFTLTEGATDAYGQPINVSSVSLDQLWLKFDVGRRVFLTLGDQKLKWGSGRFWNPTDFLNQQVLDPLAAYDLRPGVPLLKVHIPVQALGANLYAIANLDQASAVDRIGGAVRAEWAGGSTEFAVSGAARKDQPVRLGADLSTAIWLVDLHVEGAVRHGEPADFWEGGLDIETLDFPTAYSREREWIPQVTAGAQIGFNYSTEDAVYLGGEYFYNGSGYSEPSIYPWLLLTGQYQPFYLGEHYAAAYIFLPEPGRIEDQSYTASALTNLSDGSVLTRVDWSLTVLTQLSLNVYAQYHFGDVGEFNFSLDIPAVPGVEGLEEGYSITPPTLDLGAGLTVAF
ncbi:MAG: hypothetical protein EXR69_03725 [Myxococcales bacterium]|nr:hypothetical protein [Myxococcales bacterium]